MGRKNWKNQGGTLAFFWSFQSNFIRRIFLRLMVGINYGELKNFLPVVGCSLGPFIIYRSKNEKYILCLPVQPYSPALFHLTGLFEIDNKLTKRHWFWSSLVSLNQTKSLKTIDKKEEKKGKKWIKSRCSPCLFSNFQLTFFVEFSMLEGWNCLRGTKIVFDIGCSR